MLLAEMQIQEVIRMLFSSIWTMSHEAWAYNLPLVVYYSTHVILLSLSLWK